MADLLGPIDGLAEQALVRHYGAEYGDLLQSRTLLDRLRSGQRGADPEATRQALRSVAKEFESVFLLQLVTAMRKTVGDGGLVEKGNAERVFEGMLDEEWSRRLAGRHGPSGLSEILYRQLSRQLGLDKEAAGGTAEAVSRAPATPAPHPLLQLPATAPPAGLRASQR